MTLAQQFFSREPTIQQENGNTFHLHSNFTAAINYARTATGRCDTNGTIICSGDTGGWLGNLAYLCLIDLLAKCFDPTTGGNRKKFTGFLMNSGLTPADAKTLYALRCSFAHEFGLANKSEHGTEHTIFKLIANSTQQMITRPRETDKWDGNYDNITEACKTQVNLEKVADKIETIVESLKQKAENCTLTIQLDANEFSKRFFFRVGPMEYNAC